MTDIASLIARLEAAPFGARGFDEEIWLALGGTLQPVREVGGHSHTRWIDADGSRRTQETTNFTTSLDDALLLVPEHHTWTVSGPDMKPQAYACLCDRGKHQPIKPWLVEYPVFECDAATPALALCIASLKARAAQAEGKL